MADSSIFASYVTSTAFSISLSGAMVHELILIASLTPNEYHVRARGSKYDNCVPTRRRLRERGLIEAPDPEFAGRYQLTDAGKHMVELLKLAWLAEEVKQEEAACL